jgi:predicted alpha/beta superfamily hydrolase
MNLETFTMPLAALGGRVRTIRVLTPDPVPGRRYPVLYMHDGQNLFRDSEATYGTSWSLIPTLGALGLDLIVVGVDSNPVGHGRLDELSPWVNDWIRHKSDSIDRTVGGEGEGYFDFLVHELKPRIDGAYPTQPGRETTFVAGSSMGGLASLWGACRHPQVFSRAACFSSAFWFTADPLAAFLGTSPLPDRVYLDVGTAEGSRQNNEEERLSYINDTRRVGEVLAARGLGPDRLRVVFDEGGQHNEAAWARRLPGALRWWLSDLISG